MAARDPSACLSPHPRPQRGEPPSISLRRSGLAMWSVAPRPLLSIVFAVALSPLLGNAGQVNITVDDVDSSIQYHPAAWWVSSRNASGCAFCLAPVHPDIAFKGTWHHGLHIIPTNDADDMPDRHIDNDDDNDKRRGKGKGGRRRRSVRREDNDPDDEQYTYLEDPDAAALVTASPFTVQNFDADDPQFADMPVTAAFNFTGTAIYLTGLLPLFAPANSNSTPTIVNLTFTLDSQPAGTFLHIPQANGPDTFAPDTTLFSLTDLTDEIHTLQISLGPNSVLLLDSYVYTQEDLEDTGGSSASATNSPGGPTAVPSSAARPNTSGSSSDTAAKKHNTETFAAAVGASLGVLSVVATCLALSIIRRRRRSALRERALAASASEDDPPQMVMVGPAPFVPRFFPGTVPSNPPPYVGPPGIGDAGYEEDINGLEDVPPPFMVAIAQPTSPLLASILASSAMVQRSSLPSEGGESREGSVGRDRDGGGGMGMDTPLLTEGTSDTSSSRPSSFRSLPRSRTSSVVAPSNSAEANLPTAEGRSQPTVPPPSHAASTGEASTDAPSTEGDWPTHTPTSPPGEVLR